MDHMLSAKDLVALLAVDALVTQVKANDAFQELPIH